MRVSIVDFYALCNYIYQINFGIYIFINNIDNKIFLCTLLWFADTCRSPRRTTDGRNVSGNAARVTLSRFNETHYSIAVRSKWQTGV